MGEKKIVEIRKALESELGIRFNIKLFHKAVLDCIGPLDHLEECVRWKLDMKKKEGLIFIINKKLEFLTKFILTAIT